MVAYWTKSTILNIIVQMVLLLVHFILNLNPLHLVTISTPRIEKEIPPVSSSILDLHEDVMFLILSKVDSYWVLTRARFVCKRWWNPYKDPCLLCVINVHHIPEYNYDRHLNPSSYGTRDFYHRAVNHLESVTLLVVELSGGGLQKLCIQDFGRDEFLLLVSQRCSMLTSVTLIDGDPTSSGLQGCTIQGLLPVFQNLPILKVLRLLFTPIIGNNIRAAGDSCGQLTSFTLRTKDFEDEPHLEDAEEQVVAISQAMPGLTCLHLMGNHMTSAGLLSILNSCHFLQTLDLRQCHNLHYADPHLDVVARAVQQIEHVRLPSEPYKNEDGLESNYG